MATASPKSLYWKGVRTAAPFLLMVTPFGLLFGVVATEAGLSLAHTMGFSIVVIAGAAQFTALQLMTEQAPIIVILASALAVNLRMAMYSAALAPYLGPAPLWQRALIGYFNVDQTYAMSIMEYEAKPQLTVAARVAYFLGIATPICPVWYVMTYIGAVVGSTIPDAFALDFAVPITFLAIVAPAFKTLAHVAAAFTAIVLAVTLSWMPYNLWLLLAGLAGMIVGAEVERRVGRARVRPT